MFYGCSSDVNMETFGVFLALVYVFHHAAAVEVSEGDGSVTLDCHVDVSLSADMKGLSVAWRREDLYPATVHFREQGTDRLDKQNQRYRGRTSVSDPLQEKGRASLTLKEPRVSDNGTYTCIIRKLGQDLKRTEVELLVKEPFIKWPSFFLGALVGAVLCALCFFICRRLARRARCLGKKTSAANKKTAKEKTQKKPLMKAEPETESECDGN